jgi:hypothetical protein
VEVGGDQSEQRRKRGSGQCVKPHLVLSLFFAPSKKSVVFLESHIALCQTVMQEKQFLKVSKTDCLA